MHHRSCIIGSVVERQQCVNVNTCTRYRSQQLQAEQVGYSSLSCIWCGLGSPNALWHSTVHCVALCIVVSRTSIQRSQTSQPTRLQDAMRTINGIPGTALCSFNQLHQWEAISGFCQAWSTLRSFCFTLVEFNREDDKQKRGTDWHWCVSRL